jgi:single-strand DNA-binding protein
MNDINSLTITGKLTRDIEITTMRSGAEIGAVGLAVNRSRKQGDEWIEEVSFLDLKIISNAVKIAEKIHKGEGVIVTGQVQQDRWEKDGQKQSKVYVVVDQIRPLRGKEATAGDVHGQSDSRTRPATKVARNDSRDDDIFYEDNVPF